MSFLRTFAIAVTTASVACSSSSGGSGDGGSTNGGQPSGGAPTCDTATDNMKITGFGATPIALSSSSAGTFTTITSNGVSALRFILPANPGSVTIDLVSNKGVFMQGDKVQIGSEPVLTIAGQNTSGGDTYCRATSGEADINVLVADLQMDTDAGPLLQKANVSFTASCNPSTAKPSGVATVAGCWNFVGM